MTTERIVMIASRVATVAAVLVFAAVAPPTAHAESNPKKTPRHAQPSHPTQTAPDTTGSLAKPREPQRPAPSSASDGESIPAPYYLPNAPRSRMHACGQTWQAKKMSGGTGDDDWRDFARKCLAAKDSLPANSGP